MADLWLWTLHLALLMLLPHGHADSAVTEALSLDATECSLEEAVPSGTVLVANYSQLLSCGNWSRVVTITDGYHMDLVVKSLHIGPDDYVAVNSGSRMVISRSATILVGRIRTPRKLRAYGSRTIHIQFVTSASTIFDLEGFTVTFASDKLLTTTPEPTEPPSTLATAPVGVDDTYTIYISGRPAVDFLEYKADLQTAVKEMAQQYCQDNNITTLQNITEQNVVFRYVERCDMTWPSSEQCAKVRLAVPLAVVSGYELTAQHIKDMWLSYAPHSAQLSRLGLQMYVKPDPQMSMLVWLGIIIGIILAFSVMLGIIWWFLNGKPRSKRAHSLTDSHSRLSTASRQSWISDMPHQELPTNTLSALREFEPDSMHTRAPFVGGPPGGRPHVPIPDSKPFPEYGGTLLFGQGFDKQALMVLADRDTRTSDS